MPRVTSVLAAAVRHGRPVIDTVILDYAQRSAQKITITGVKGGAFEIDLQQLARLLTDDLLLLDDGELVEVVAAPEPLIEARAAEVAVPKSPFPNRQLLPSVGKQTEQRSRWVPRAQGGHEHKLRRVSGWHSAFNSDRPACGRSDWEFLVPKPQRI
ncbi:MAG TPA: hypothetical protein VLN61_12850 [Pseudolabrys sp.]|nr:hypothetical protein [Pseudolabrys sp.]